MCNLNVYTACAGMIMMGGRGLAALALVWFALLFAVLYKMSTDSATASCQATKEVGTRCSNSRLPRLHCAPIVLP